MFKSFEKPDPDVLRVLSLVGFKSATKLPEINESQPVFPTGFRINDVALYVFERS